MRKVLMVILVSFIACFPLHVLSSTATHDFHTHHTSQHNQLSHFYEMTHGVGSKSVTLVAIAAVILFFGVSLRKTNTFTITLRRRPQKFRSTALGWLRYFTTSPPHFALR